MKDVESLMVFAGAHARAVCFNPGAERLLVTFDNWRKDHVAFPEAVPSRGVMQAGFGQLCVHSTRNDWYLSPDLAALRTALSQFCAGYAEVRGIGFSMGGYGALLLSKALRLDKVVLVSPQVSIFPQRYPHDDRYAAEAAELDPAQDQLAQDIVGGLQGVILFDPIRQRKDAAHARAIAALAPGLQVVAMPLSGHPAMGAIREARLYGRVLQAAMTGRLSVAEFRAIHRAARAASPRYQALLDAYLNRRGLR